MNKGLSGIKGNLKDLKLENLSNIFSSFGTFISEGKNIAIGYDSKKYSFITKELAISAFIGSGVNPVVLKNVTTPVLQFFISNTVTIDGGIMIKEDSDKNIYVQFFNKKGKKLLPNEMEVVLDIYHSKEFFKATWDKLGKLKEENSEKIENKYIGKLKKFLNLNKLYNNCGIFTDDEQVYYLLKKVINGKKINVLKEKKDIKKYKDKLDFILVLKGDSTISEIITKKKTYPAHFVYPLILQFFLKNKKGKIITSLSSSKNIESSVYNEVIRCKSRLEFISEAIENEKGIIGGESCGSIVFPEISFAYDNVVSSLYIAINGDKVIDRLRNIKTDFILKDSIVFTSDKVFYILNKLKTYYEKKEKNINFLDGIYIQKDGYFFSIRAAGSEEALRIVFEGKDKEKIKKEYKNLRNLIKKYMR